MLLLYKGTVNHAYGHALMHIDDHVCMYVQIKQPILVYYTTVNADTWSSKINK